MRNIETIKQSLTQLHNDESGATATEYIILLVLIACFCIAVVKAFGSTVSSKFEAAQKKVEEDVTFGS